MQSIVLLFWTIFSSLIFCSSALEYSNQWVVQIDGKHEEADRLARKHGFKNFGKIIDNYFSFVHEKVEKVSKVPSPNLQKGLMSEPNVKMVDQEPIKYYKLLSTHSMHFYNPNDPRYHEMWYINRDDGQPTYNVIDVWKRNITGAGVLVAVVDVGLDPDHPEIQANYDARASFDVNDNDTNPFPSDSSGHGDKCAGVIAAVLNNSYCGVGLSYNANLGGIRLFFNTEATDGLECRALIHENDYIDIYSNSWGPADTGFDVAGPGPLTQRALKRGTQKGRGGLGSIYVFAAGNGGLGDSCAFDGYTNSIYTISIAGINSHGSIPAFGEKCAGIMAVTYSRDYFDNSTVITAGTKKTCIDNFGGSSAATAMASGLIALMLSANPRLSSRDVQHIIVRTSRPNLVNIRKYLWTINKANLSVNDYVGFGLMDATKMVYAALNWTTVPPKVNCTIPHPRDNRPIPSKGTLEETIDLSVSNWSKSCGERINYLEHVEISVNLNYSRRGDLLIKLISPQGTVSNLTHFRPSDSKHTDLNWVLMTLHLWGENAAGSWKLTLENAQVNHSNTGILFNWTLILHGTVEDPLTQNRHVLTPVIPQPTDTSLKPRKETPTNTPTKETPTDTPTNETPKDTPTKPTKETPTDTPTKETPTDTSSKETPTDTQTKETPTDTPIKKTKETPTDTPTKETPTDTSTKETPTDTPTKETPTDASPKPTKETPTDTPTKETPTNTPTKETPTDTPTKETPTDTPTKETPRDTSPKPTKETPTDTPTKETPTDTSRKETPTDTPTKETPTDTSPKPTKETPTDTPTKITPTNIPTKETPTDTPTKISRTDTSTKITPTDTSTKITPTDTPTKITPTDTPTKKTPTDTPTKETPTDTSPKPTKETSMDTSLKPTKETPTDSPTKETPTDTPTKITPTDTSTKGTPRDTSPKPTKETPTDTPIRMGRWVLAAFVLPVLVCLLLFTCLIYVSFLKKRDYKIKEIEEVHLLTRPPSPFYSVLS